MISTKTMLPLDGEAFICQISDRRAIYLDDIEPCLLRMMPEKETKENRRNG